MTWKIRYGIKQDIVGMVNINNLFRPGQDYSVYKQISGFYLQFHKKTG